MAKSVLLKSSLAKKYWMALTGLFLCLFLVGHLAGNLQLMASFDPKTGEAMYNFDAYAKFMTTNPFVKILSYLTYASILFHAVDGFLLAAQNRKARASKYAYENANANSRPQSRYMAQLGTLILLFIIIHMANFWGQMHFGDMEPYTHDGEEYKPLYALVIYFFKNPDFGAIAAILYAVSMAVLAFHLSHGFQAAFQSLGFNHPRYTPIIKKIGLGFSILIPLLFAIIPLYIAFGLEIPDGVLEYFEKSLLS